MAVSTDRTKVQRLGFSRGPFQSDDAALSELSTELQGALNFNAFSADVLPSVDRAYNLGSDDKSFNEVHSHQLQISGTTTFKSGLVSVDRGSVMEFATNSSLLIVPVYTGGESPFNLWHPSSGFLRMGAVWIQTGSPAKLMVHAFGEDRMLGVWDTTTCTQAGSVVWEVDCNKKVFLSKNQHANAAEFGLEVTGTCTFGTATFEGPVYGIELNEIDNVAVTENSGDLLQHDGTNWVDISVSDLATQLGPVIGPVVDHGSLSGLGDDDHTLYFKADGSRSMAGDIDLSSNNINNIGYAEFDGIGGAVVQLSAAQSSTSFTVYFKDSIPEGEDVEFLAAVASTGSVDVDGDDFAGDVTFDTDTLAVDSVNHRVGIGTTSPGTALEVSGILTIGETGGGADTITIEHDGSNAYLKLDDGSFVFQTNEGTNTNTYLDVKGKGTGVGYQNLYDQNNAEWLQMYCSNGLGFIHTSGTSPGGIHILYDAAGALMLFEGSASGETQELKIYGYRAADAKRSLEIGVGVDAADQASFDGLSTYYFDGKVKGLTAHFGGAANYTEIESDGTIKFNGDATVWDDVRVAANSTKTGATTYQPTWAQLKDDGSSSRGVYLWWFSDSAENEVFFTVQLPHGWKEASSVIPHVHWVAETGDTGDVEWFLEYTYADIEDNYGNTSTVSGLESGVDTQDKHYVTTLDTITMSGKNISGMFVCRLYRDGGQGNDSYPAKAGFLEFDLHIEMDTVGSRTTTSK